MTQVSFEQLVQRVGAGTDLASFPTDTVPALAARPEAARLIFAAKQRQFDKPLILMAAEAQDIWPYVKGTDAEIAVWQQVGEQYWPGALTLVLPTRDSANTDFSVRAIAAMNPADPTTIGVRVPNHTVARSILSHTGVLATTSANRSGHPPLLTMAEISAQFPQVLMLSEAELASLTPNQLKTSAITASGLPSTVARWNGSGWDILRQGAILLH